MQTNASIFDIIKDGDWDHPWYIWLQRQLRRSFAGRPSAKVASFETSNASHTCRRASRQLMPL